VFSDLPNSLVLTQSGDMDLKVLIEYRLRKHCPIL